MTSRRNDATMTGASTEHVRNYSQIHALSAAISTYLSLPGLRGFWPMSAFNGAGGAIDVSGQSRLLTLNGNLQYGYSGQIPYANFDGTNSYLDRADETSLDILGNESFVETAMAGLTMGGWWKFDDITSHQCALMAKNAASPNRSLLLRKNNADIDFYISGNGTDYIGPVSNASAVGTTLWHFICSRYDPSTEIALFVDLEKDVFTTAIPASLYNNSAAFEIGSQNTQTHFFDGKASMCFLSNGALSDGIIRMLYQQTRALFNR